MRLPPVAVVGAAILVVACVAALALAFLPAGVPSFAVPFTSQQEADSDDSASKRASDEGSAEGESVLAGDAAEPPPATLTVHVVGAVASPGICEVPEGSRVQDAVDAAGGFSDAAATDAVNLARVLQDGEQVVIPTKEQVEQGEFPVAEASSSSDDSTQQVVNINTAGVEELDALPGVGPATAQAIVEERETGGPFATIEDIQRVSGIGEKKFEKMKESICV